MNAYQAHRVFGAIVLSVTVAGGCFSQAAFAAEAGAKAGRFAEGRLLVKPRAGVSDAALAQVLKGGNARSERRMHRSAVRVVSVPAKSEKALARWLAKHPEIEYAEIDQLVAPQDFIPNDTYYGYAWHLPMISAPAAWDSSLGAGVTVALIDSGVDAAHPELSAQLVAGWNVISDNTDTTDVDGHGTKVAGVIAATGNNALGVTGMAWNAALMPVRVTERVDGYAYWSDIADAITWAADHGARVANVSYDVNLSSTVDNAAAYMRSLGGVVVTAAGNEGHAVGFETPNTISVSATGSDDALMSWSNFGLATDLAAPGNAILTTQKANTYANAAGTSFSSPVVAGVAALMLSVNPDLSAADVEAILKTSADDLGAPGWDDLYAHGRVNAGAAVQMAMNWTGPDVTAPTVAITSPAASTLVAGAVAVDVAASDDQAVTQVRLYANGTLVASDTTAPFLFSWDSSLVADGSVNLVAQAYDAAGNQADSAPVTVEVDNVPNDVTAPTVAIASPTSGASVSTTVQVALSAADDFGVTSVALYANGTLVGTDTSAPYEIALNTTAFANGSLTLTANAYDAAGNLGTTTTTVTVNNAPADTIAPVATITSPVAGRTYSGNVTLTATATDNVAVTAMTFYVDGAAKCSGTSASLSCVWNAKYAARGNHTITVKAWDAAGNLDTKSIIIKR